MSKPKLSIGIPAYNEQANIHRLLLALLGQVQDNFDLLEIIVVSDGSTDRTVDAVRQVPDPVISLTDRPERLGLALTQNEIIGKFQGDILLMLNADTLIEDHRFASNMVAPFLNSPNIGIVGARITPLPAENFFEKVISNSAQMKQRMYESISQGDNIYLCHGRGRAFSREFVKTLRFPKAVGEDAYSYITCQENGYGFQYQPLAEVMYRCPQTMREHLGQSVRFLRSKMNWETNRKPGAGSYYHIPAHLIFRAVLNNFLAHPVLLSVYLAVYMLAWVKSSHQDTSVLWDVAASSKALIK